jgi:FkbM family methyltransferase
MNLVDLAVSNAKQATRAVKRSIVTTAKGGSFPIDLEGHKVRVVYECRANHAERDYGFLARLATDATCILDVGGNVGLTSLLMASVSKASIHLFEASEAASVLAMQNLALNGLAERVRVVNALVTDRPGDVVEFFWDASSGGNSMSKGRLGHEFGIFKASVNLDDYCERLRLRPDVWKVDVEGAEAIVLRGARRLLREVRPRIGLELHGWDGLSIVENGARVLEVLASVDYQMIYLRSREVVTDPKVFADRGRCHVLLLPREAAKPAWLSELDPRL